MQVLVIFEVFDTIIERERFAEARVATKRQLQAMIKNGNVVTTAAFSDRRGGFAVLEVKSGEGLLSLLAPGFTDNCHIQTYPLLSWENQADALKRFFGDGAK